MMTLRTLTGGLMGMVLAVALLPQAKAGEGTTTQNTLLDRIQIEDLMIEYYWAFSTKKVTTSRNTGPRTANSMWEAMS